MAGLSVRVAVAMAFEGIFGRILRDMAGLSVRGGELVLEELPSLEGDLPVEESFAAFDDMLLAFKETNKNIENDFFSAGPLQSFIGASFFSSLSGPTVRFLLYPSQHPAPQEETIWFFSVSSCFFSKRQQEFDQDRQEVVAGPDRHKRSLREETLVAEELYPLNR